MPGASYAVPNFLGGEISQFAQGRFDRPDYRTSLSVCFNAFPVEIGAWVRRPGTQFAGTTRGGAKGRVLKFDFEQANAVTAEFTDGWVRFRAGPTLLTTNDAQVVVSISAANPAVLQTTTAATWVTGNTVMFKNLGSSAPLLQNRQFLLTKIDTTHFSLTDALTGATIDGSTLGAISLAASVVRVQELTTAYVGGTWSAMRAVQAETTDILLAASVAPQALTVATLPSTGVDAQFAINAAVFQDGPYLDPFTNGVLATPGAQSGIVSIALAFNAYKSDKAYARGAFVTSGGVNYVSISDQNVGNPPASSPLSWTATSASSAIGPSGFQGTDIGRLVRFFSEPPLWDSTASYSTGTVVTYNPSGLPGASTYWQSLTNTNTSAPGADLTHWQIVPQGAALWTWGKITSLTNTIDRSLAGSVVIGNMNLGGGISAPFNGVFGQLAAQSAEASTTGGFLPINTQVICSAYVGKNFSGATPQKIQQATVYPSSDNGFAFGSWTDFSGSNFAFIPVVSLNLRGKMTPPANSSDGTLLGFNGTTTNTKAAITLVSNDATTAWNYVWVEIIASAQIGSHGTTVYGLAVAIGQLSFSGPPGTGVASGVNVEILGPKLLYTTPIVTWRLGVYSDTTGWPTCGCYHEGRLWLSGAVANRFDASVSDGINGGTINFAPTDQYGAVATSNAISYTLNSDGVNPIFWMEPDLQGIIIGTQAGEWLVQAPTSGPLAPTNIAARRVTKIGCANVEPRRTEHTTVFAQRYGRKLMEYFADVYSGKFSAPNVADKAQHIIQSGIAELAYQSAATPIIWGRDAAGALFGVTYKRDTLATSQGPTFAAWHRHRLGSGRTVESVCGGPSIGGDLDTLTMVTTNDASGGIRHVELLTDVMGETAALADAWFCDDAIEPSSTSTTTTPSGGAPYGGATLNGLWHLNGQTVSVFAGGLDCGDFLIANGSCFVPFGDRVSAGTANGLFSGDFLASFPNGCPIVVGYTFTSQSQLVRPISPPDTGARNGPGFGKIGRAHRYAVKLLNTLGLSVGADFAKTMYPASFRQENGKAIAALTMFSGIHQDSLQDDYGYESALCWQITRPFPANVIAIGPNLSTQDQ